MQGTFARRPPLAGCVDVDPLRRTSASLSPLAGCTGKQGCLNGPAAEPQAWCGSPSGQRRKVGGAILAHLERG